MGQIDYGEDVLIFKNNGEDSIDANVKIISKSLAFEIDFLCKIERVLRQNDHLS